MDTTLGSNNMASNLTVITDPVSSTGHAYRTRARKSASAGKQVDIRMQLFSDGQIHVQDFTAIDEVWTTRERALTATEADSITNYALLSIWFDSANVGGGAGRTCHSSTFEFECPDAGTPEQKNWIRTGHVPNMYGVRPGTRFGRSW